MTKVKIKILNKSSNESPKQQTAGDAGFDIRANLKLEKILHAGTQSMIPTGIFMEIPIGYEAQVRPRSGLAAKNGVTVLNSPGTIDCFSEDSLIRTMDGEKTISRLTIKDIVLTMNEDSGEIEKCFIEKIIDKGFGEILEIETEGGVLKVTDNTEVYTKNGVKYAKDLTLEDEIISLF